MSGLPLPVEVIVSVEWLHALAGVVVAAVALQVARAKSHPRRVGATLFWSLLSLTFFARLVPTTATLAGHPLIPVLVGVSVLAMVTLAATKQVLPPIRIGFKTAGETTEREREAARLGNRLLVPPLVLAIVAAAGAAALPKLSVGGRPLVDAGQANTIAVGLGAVVALLLALRLTGTAQPQIQTRFETAGGSARGSGWRVVVAMGEGGRLIQLLGWALILPQLLATLGGVFAKCGVGDVIARAAANWDGVNEPFSAVVAYCVAMPLFTILMGNAFAAFPLITLGIGVPFIVRQHGGDPAIMGAFGMLAGYCGTLVTPMAANFNVVPVLLLEIPDRYAVIKAQAPFALACWLFNLAAMAALVYRF